MHSHSLRQTSAFSVTATSLNGGGGHGERCSILRRAERSGRSGESLSTGNAGKQPARSRSPERGPADIGWRDRSVWYIQDTLCFASTQRCPVCRSEERLDGQGLGVPGRGALGNGSETRFGFGTEMYIGFTTLRRGLHFVGRHVVTRQLGIRKLSVPGCCSRMLGLLDDNASNEMLLEVLDQLGRCSGRVCEFEQLQLAKGTQ